MVRTLYSFCSFCQFGSIRFGSFSYGLEKFDVAALSLWLLHFFNALSSATRTRMRELVLIEAAASRPFSYQTALTLHENLLSRCFNESEKPAPNSHFVSKCFDPQV